MAKSAVVGRVDALREVVQTARYDPLVAEARDKPLSEQLEEIRAQLDWVRDYL